MGCCGECSRWILFIFNFLLFLCGCAGLGLGIWALVDDDEGTEAFNDLGGDENKGRDLALIIGSGILMFITFMGCCGAKTENQVCLGIYFAIMLFIFLVFLGITIAIFAFKDDILDEYADTLEDEIKNNYGQTGQEDDATKHIDKIQQEFECCGVRGDFMGNKSWMFWQQSAWYRDTGKLKNMLVPASCCKKNKADPQCQGSSPVDTKPPQWIIHPIPITKENDQLYGKGCIDELDDYYEDHFLALGLLAGAVCFVILFCMITACYICQRRGKQGNIV